VEWSWNRKLRGRKTENEESAKNEKSTRESHEENQGKTNE
jgi:hypothetical protein